MAGSFKIISIAVIAMFISYSQVYSGSVPFQKITVTHAPAEGRQYEKSEWDITVKASWKNPYLYTDISLDMIIESPSGKQLLLPCYYESGKSGSSSKWKARFAPKETGQYRYTFKLQEQNKKPVMSASSVFSVEATGGKGFMHRNNDWTFKFDNGSMFRGIGENICWEARSNDDSKYFKELHENARFNYEYLLGTLAKNGGNYFRTWMCAWNLPLEWRTVINTNRYTNSTEHFNPSSFERIEKMLSMSESLGLYTMLTLDGAVGFGGGIWKTSLYNTANGGPAKTPAEFFSSREAKDLYRSKLRYLVARYGCFTSIGAWEFFNEIDNAMYGQNPPIEGKLIVQWHEEMSAYLKSIDPYEHLVTTSISHRDIDGLNSIPSIDFNQKHIYKNTDAVSSAIKTYAAKYGKPYVIGEFGFEWDWSKNFNDYAEDFDLDFKRGLWYGLFSATPVLPMSWWWEFFDNRNTPVYFNRVRKIYDQMMAAGNGEFSYASISSEKEIQHLYGVKCGEKYFVYVQNYGRDTLVTRLTLNDLTKRELSIEVYHPETNTETVWSDFRLDGNSIHIDRISLKAKEDLIFIVSPAVSASIK